LKRSQHGFTLIELLIVMVIITILAGISIALYSNGVSQAEEAVLKTDLKEMREAIDAYHADKNKWPPSGAGRSGYPRGGLADDAERA
jgi:general secretion pathway protein G